MRIKKILSGLVAASMIMSMSMVSFADIVFGTETTLDNNVDVEKIIFDKDVTILDRNNIERDVNTDKLYPGDTILFPVKVKNTKGEITNLYTKADKDWKLFIRNNDIVKDVVFMNHSITTTNKPGVDNTGNLYIAVKLKDDINFLKYNKTEFAFYIHDNENGHNSGKVFVEYDLTIPTISENDLDWILDVSNYTAFKYVGKEPKVALIKMGTLYYKTTLLPNEKYLMTYKNFYNKEVSKLYETDIEEHAIYSNSMLHNSIFIPSELDNKQVVEIVGNSIFPIESTFVKHSQFINGTYSNGYIIDVKNVGNYALIDKDVELEDEEVVVPEIPLHKPVKPEKPNPETGSKSFVGLAIALMSLSAAGVAYTIKK